MLPSTTWVLGAHKTCLKGSQVLASRWSVIIIRICFVLCCYILYILLLKVFIILCVKISFIYYFLYSFSVHWLIFVSFVSFYCFNCLVVPNGFVFFIFTFFSIYIVLFFSNYLLVLISSYHYYQILLLVVMKVSFLYVWYVLRIPPMPVGMT